MNSRNKYPERINASVKHTWVHEDCFTNLDFNYIKTFIYYETQELAMHSHLFYEINLIINGEGRHYFENNSYDAFPGCVFVIPPGIRHGYYTHSNLDIYNILIINVFIEHYQKELVTLPGYFLLFDIEPNLRTTSKENLFLIMDKPQLSETVEKLNLLLSLNDMYYN